MRRRRGRGREGVTTTSTAVAPAAPLAAETADRLVAALADELTNAAQGVDFIYTALARVVAEYGVHDAIVVVDEPPLGRQLFRAGRRRLDDAWSERLLLDGALGLHLACGPLDNNAVSGIGDRVSAMCALALRLDAARYDAQHDPLTGLYNRRAFNELLGQACARTQRDGSRFSLVLLDIDGFKAINDRLGHSAGDNILQALGSDLHHQLRAGDIAARIGGDEFALVLPIPPGADPGDDFVARLVDRVEEGLTTMLIDLDITLSSGTATAPTDSAEPVELAEIADRRLYAAKGST